VTRRPKHPSSSGRRPAERPPAGGPRPPRRAGAEAVGVRIVGGKFRGRKLAYSGDRRVRPMKDRVREALFNLLGPAVRRMHAVDLFAGTGALALEALSRGAHRATLVERHFPTAKIIRQNIATLGVESLSELIETDVFLWWADRPPLGDEPWLVLCSPPYDFFVDRREEMLELIGGVIGRAPPGSAVAVESDRRFDPAQLPRPEDWDVRPYPPAVVAIHWKP